MNPDTLHEAVEKFALAHEIGSNVILMVTLIGLYLMRSFLDQFVYGIVWKVSRRYTETDEVIIDGNGGRIVRIGLFNVEVYIYQINEAGQVVGGFSWMIANDKLRDYKILKPLRNISIPTKLDSVYKDSQPIIR